MKAVYILAARIGQGKRHCENAMYPTNAKIVRQYSLFQDKLVLKISIDEVEVLQITIDTATLDFVTTLCDCSLDVLANESILAVKLISHFCDEGVLSKGE